MKKKMIAGIVAIGAMGMLSGSSGNDGNSLRQQWRDTDSRNQHP